MLLKFLIKRWNNDVVGHFVFLNFIFTIFSKFMIYTYTNIRSLEKTFTKKWLFLSFLMKKCLNQIFHWEFTNREKKSKNPSYRILTKIQIWTFNNKSWFSGQNRWPSIFMKTKKRLFLIRNLLTRRFYPIKMTSY